MKFTVLFLIIFWKFLLKSWKVFLLKKMLLLKNKFYQNKYEKGSFISRNIFLSWIEKYVFSFRI